MNKKYGSSSRIFAKDSPFFNLKINKLFISLGTTQSSNAINNNEVLSIWHDKNILDEILEIIGNRICR